jgi:GxxExxY protein
MRVHRAWGPGLLESAYAVALAAELDRRGHRVEREVPVPVEWGGGRIDCAYRIDLLVDDCLVVELKSVERVAPVHQKQVLTYLKLTHMRLGLLINFGRPLLKQGIQRIANGMP